MFLSWSADWLDRAEALKSVDDRAEALAGETGDSPPGRVSRRGDSPRREGESSRGRAKEPVAYEVHSYSAHTGTGTVPYLPVSV